MNDQNDAVSDEVQRLTIVSAPLAHISLTRIFLCWAFESEESEKAQNAIVFAPSGRDILSWVSLKAFRHVT